MLYGSAFETALIEQRPLAALMETAAYPNSQTLLLLVTMQQFVTNHREWEGYDYFGVLSRDNRNAERYFARCKRSCRCAWRGTLDY